MAWNYLQVETAGRVLHPTIGPGDMTRAESHAFVRTLLVRHAENVPYTQTLVSAWDAGAADDTVFAGSFLWAIYEADDTMAGARAWVAELAQTLSAPGPKVRVAW